MAETTNPVKRAGVIGLGAMGLQMARNLVAKGFQVAGYDIKAEANALAKSHGVGLCGSVAELGSRADVVIVMVQTDDQVGEVVLGSGLLDRLAPGRGLKSRQGRQLVPRALGQEHGQMVREGHGRGAGAGAGCENAGAARRPRRSAGEADQSREDEGAAVLIGAFEPKIRALGSETR